MIIKAIAFFQPDGYYEIKVCENPTAPRMTKTHVKIRKEFDLALDMPTTVMVDVELTFECLLCDFKTDSYKLMMDHSNSHK